MGPDVCTPAVLRLIAGSDWPDSCQAVDEDGHSLIAAGDAINVVFRQVQGGQVLLTVPCEDLEPASGHFWRPITAAHVAALRTALELPDQASGRCSIAYQRVRAGAVQTLARGACILEPEA